MRKKFIYITTLSILFFLASCSGGQKESSAVAKQKTPAALQESESDLKSYSRSTSDLTEELYQELVDKTPLLKKLEADMEALRPKAGELEEAFNKYDGKSNSYYVSAGAKAAGITDSLLRQKIVAFIASSSRQYAYRTSEINALMKQISRRGATLGDHHAVLKIVLTLPLIEKYQKENLPDKREFKDLLKAQDKLIERTDSLTPEF